MMAFICFVTILVFIIVTYIPGTPYEIFRNEHKAAQSYSTQEEMSVEGSLRLDSSMMVINGFLNISPSIYYAETFLITDFPGFLLSPKPAIFCSIGYLIIALAFYFIPISVQGLQEITLSATAPVLFVIGLKITAPSMLSNAEKGIEDSINLKGSANKTSGTLYYYMPAATTALVTHVAWLMVALPIGVIVYSVYSIANKIKVEIFMRVLTGISFFICLLLSTVIFTQKTDEKHPPTGVDSRGCEVVTGTSSYVHPENSEKAK